MKHRKLLSLLMVMFLLAGVVTGCGEEEKKVSISSTEAKSGEEVQLLVKASGDAPVAGYSFEISFDTSMLSMVEYGKTSDFSDAWAGLDLNDDDLESGRISLVGVNTNEAQQYYSGDLFYLKFKVIGEAGEKTEVKLQVKELDTFDLENKVEEYAVENGTVTIK